MDHRHNGEHRTSDTALDWRGYIVEAGHFWATFPAHILGAWDDEDAAATIAVFASACEFAGVMLTFEEPHPVPFSETVWFTLDAARTYAAAVEAAAASEGPTCARLQAWTCDDEPTDLELEVVTDPNQFNGVFLDTGNFLVSRHHATDIARAILAAIDYLIANGAQQ